MGFSLGGLARRIAMLASPAESWCTLNEASLSAGRSQPPAGLVLPPCYRLLPRCSAGLGDLPLPTRHRDGCNDSFALAGTTAKATLTACPAIGFLLYLSRIHATDTAAVISVLVIISRIYDFRAVSSGCRCSPKTAVELSEHWSGHSCAIELWSSSSAIRLSPSQIRACGFPAPGSSRG
jgi:hypothetical protein